MTQDPRSDGGQPAREGGSTVGERMQSMLREIAETVLPALVIVLVLNLFLVQTTRVDQQSMEPTLHPGQLLVLEKVSYYFHPPQRGNIVVFRLGTNPPSYLIKRVIALPGETFEIKDGHVYINGQLLDEPYISQVTYPPTPPEVIPEGTIFVMGDNRGVSNDSRSFGPVPLSDVTAHAWLRYWPPNRIGVLR